MSSTPGPAASWARLPEEVLVRVLSHLPDRERARAALVCRPWAATTLCPKLWAKLEVALAGEDSAGQLLTWLLPRGRELAELRIRGTDSTSARSWGSVTALCACVAASLRRLHLHANELEVGAWLAPLRGLRHASFTATISMKVEDMRTWPLPALETLMLHCEFEAEIGVIPPMWSASLTGLTILVFKGFDIYTSNGSTILKGLPQLRSLRLASYDRNITPPDGEWRFPSELRRLERLCLEGPWPGPLSPELTALTALRILELCGIKEARLIIDGEENARVLGALSRLEVLDCRGCDMARIPEALLRSTNLKALWLTNMRMESRDEPGDAVSVSLGPFKPHLLWLRLDVDVARKSVAVLQTCLELRRLDLVLRERDEAVLGYELPAIDGLHLALESMPRLQQLHVIPAVQQGPAQLDFMRFLVDTAALGRVKVTFPVLHNIPSELMRGGATVLELLEST